MAGAVVPLFDPPAGGDRCFFEKIKEPSESSSVEVLRRLAGGGEIFACRTSPKGGGQEAKRRWVSPLNSHPIFGRAGTGDWFQCADLSSPMMRASPCE